MKKHHFASTALVLVLIIAITQPVRAEDHLYYHMDSQNQDSVVIFNRSAEVQEGWVLFYEGHFQEEWYFQVPPRSFKSVDVRAWNSDSRDWVVLTKNSELQLPSSWSQDKGSHFEVSLTDSTEIRILNLFPQVQQIRLEYQNDQGQTLKTEHRDSPAYLKSQSWLLAPPPGTQRLQLQAQTNIMLHTKAPFQIRQDKSRKALAGRVYFLVSGDEGSSFVAPLEDPKLIDKVRKEMAHPQGFMIFADLDWNWDEPNRNLASSSGEYWSWKIKRVTGFSQVGADWCFAYPEYIERMLHIWMEREKACFRGQKIIRELTAEEVESGRLNP